MVMRTLSLLILCILLFTAYPVQSIDPDYYDCDYWISDTTPSNYESDVPITAKGVQTCINISLIWDVTIAEGCYANVTFQWHNTSGYFDALMDYLSGEGPEPTYSDYWYNYSHWSALGDYAGAGEYELCAYNSNVTCYTEGNFVERWRAILEFNCTNPQFSFHNTTELCTFYYIPEECPLSYIYPPTNSTDICPCCDCICTTISNRYGHPMNVSIYTKNINDIVWREAGRWIETSNDTLCHCLDGFIEDAYARGHTTENFTASAINTWYNVSFINFSSNNIDGTPSSVTVPYNGHYTLWYQVSFKSLSASPAGESAALRMIRNNIEINGSYRELDFQKQDNLREVISFVHTYLDKHDTINFQWITNNKNVLITEDNTWSAHNTSAYAMIIYEEAVSVPLKYNTTYQWYVEAVDTTTGEVTTSDIFFFTTEQDPEDCPCGEEDLIEIISENDKIKDDTWILGPAILFSIFGILAYINLRRKK